jgi:precorrin-2/cobalt-factor-2 C20-methyltransferase
VQKCRSAEEKTTFDDELDSKWDETSKKIIDKLDQGKDVAFLTLGDPAVYSTYFYLHDRLLELQPGLKIEIIPGVSSVNAAAARARISLGLGNDRIALLPANYMDNLRSALETFDTVVLMKVNKVLNEIVTLLSEMKLVENAVCISRAGLEDEKVFHDIRMIDQNKLNYFSMIIVRK